MRGILFTLPALLFTALTPVSAEVQVANNLSTYRAKAGEAPQKAGQEKYRGWDYLISKLKADGVSEAKLAPIYLNKRLPPFEVVYFKLNPRESSSIYAAYKTKPLIESANEYLQKHRKSFAAAEKKYKVDRRVIASILLIETRFGKNTGKEMALNRLSRVASIAKPENVLANYQKLSAEDPAVTFAQVEARAKYLEDKFYPEILAILEIAKRNKINPLGIRGSSAGAFGLPQFLPSTYLRFGADGNGDGKVSLYNISDAIFSTANFLSNYGWNDRAERDQKEFVIWNYNQSDAYVEAVLSVADQLVY